MVSKKKKIAIFSLTSIILIAGIIFTPALIDSVSPTPQFVEEDWIELDKIANISKYDSAIGHSYPYPWTPTSKKHYFRAFDCWGNSDNEVKIFAPVDGKITWIMDESHRVENDDVRGKQIHLLSKKHPSLTFVFFHVNIEKTNIKLLQDVKAGTELGFADMREECDTDIAVMRGVEYISWFDILDEELLEKYKIRGINTDNLKKSKDEIEETENDGYGFDNEDPRDWIQLSVINCSNYD